MTKKLACLFFLFVLSASLAQTPSTPSSDRMSIKISLPRDASLRIIEVPISQVGVILVEKESRGCRFEVEAVKRYAEAIAQCDMKLKLRPGQIFPTIHVGYLDRYGRDGEALQIVWRETISLPPKQE